jgi:hypothetical protein
MKFAPLLMATTAVLAGGQRAARVVAVANKDARGAMTLIALVLLLVSVGFYGAQRFWLDAAFHGEPYSIGEAAAQTRRCFGRFFVLGLCVGLAAFPVLFLVGAVNSANPVVARALLLVTTFVIDVILTFVVPALALTTTSVGQAFAIGRRVVAQTGRASLWYRVAPGIALLSLSELLPTSTALGVVSVVFAMLSSLIALWFKGAILAFYLRQRVAPGGGGDTR